MRNAVTWRVGVKKRNRNRLAAKGKVLDRYNIRLLFQIHEATAPLKVAALRAAE
jgi:hypothetical protein